MACLQYTPQDDCVPATHRSSLQCKQLPDTERNFVFVPTLCSWFQKVKTPIHYQSCCATLRVVQLVGRVWCWLTICTICCIKSHLFWYFLCNGAVAQLVCIVCSEVAQHVSIGIQSLIQEHSFLAFSGLHSNANIMATQVSEVIFNICETNTMARKTQLKLCNHVATWILCCTKHFSATWLIVNGLLKPTASKHLILYNAKFEVSAAMTMKNSLLERDAVQFCAYLPTLWRNLLCLSSRTKGEPCKETNAFSSSTCHLLLLLILTPWRWRQCVPPNCGGFHLTVQCFNQKDVTVS
jgi:hypothetical protein